MTASDYAKLQSITQSAARHRLEMLTALGFAERRTYPNKATEFTITETQSAKPIRLKCDGTAKAKLLMIPSPGEPLRKRIIELLEQGPLTTGEIMRHFALHTFQFTACQLNILARRKRVTKTIINNLQTWSIAATGLASATLADVLSIPRTPAAAKSGSQGAA